MNRIKFTLLAASLTLAMALTLSCSDDKDDDGVVSCKHGTYLSNLKGYNQGEVCEEFPKSVVAARGATIDDVKEDCESHSKFTGVFADGNCPGGYVLRCPNEYSASSYLYGEEFKGVTCDELYDAW